MKNGPPDDQYVYLPTLPILGLAEGSQILPGEPSMRRVRVSELPIDVTPERTLVDTVAAALEPPDNRSLLDKIEEASEVLDREGGSRYGVTITVHPAMQRHIRDIFTAGYYSPVSAFVPPVAFAPGETTIGRLMGMPVFLSPHLNKNQILVMNADKTVKVEIRHELGDS